MLVLHPKIIDEPNYEELAPGDIAGWLDSYYQLPSKQWTSVPASVVGLPIRFEGPNYRRPVSVRAKVGAAFRAAPKWLKSKVLRKK